MLLSQNLWEFYDIFGNFIFMKLTELVYAQHFNLKVKKVMRPW